MHILYIFIIKKHIHKLDIDISSFPLPMGLRRPTFCCIATRVT